VRASPPKEIELKIMHATAEEKQELRILTLDTATVKEVRTAVAKILEEKSLDRVKLVKRYGAEGFMGLSDTEIVGKRRELLMLGRELPSPNTDPPISVLLPSVEVPAAAAVVAAAPDRPSAPGMPREEQNRTPFAPGMPSVAQESDSGPVPSVLRQELKLMVWIDRDLNLSYTFKIREGNTVSDLKHLIAAADPTGQTQVSEIGLKLADSDAEHVLADSEQITAAFAELELCTPDEQ
jgi:hypothetical protein